jgi:mannose-6-phosphate isomerase-like protein (cupin superfamily)
MDGAPLLRLAPYQANLEVRAAPGPAAIHEKEAELFVVLDGAGSIITGGKLVAETRRNADNLSGSGITGGVTRKIAKGDVFIVPQNTAHWFNAIDGRLVLMSFHVPRASARDP